jgi:hypothetical protein
MSHADEHTNYFGRETELAIEWRRLCRKLDGLYAAQRAGDKTVLTGQRIAQLERLQACLLGDPAALMP